MDLFFKKTLFDKHLFVNDYLQPSNDATEIRYALAQKLGIWVESGWEDLHLDEIRLASEKLGRFVPEAFYVNFPESVQALSGFTLYLDQMLHYAKTYGHGDFDQPGRSLFEEEIKRSAMSEKVKPQTFRMISEKEAEKVLADLAEDLLSSTRPLSPDRFEFLKNYILSVNPPVRHCACKDTAIRLLLETRDFSFSHFLSLSDVMKTVDFLNYFYYGSNNVRKLNLRNADRKFLSALLDSIFERGNVNTVDCFEKQALWQGFLHHIHYRPKTEKAQSFVSAIRNGKNRSAYSAFERKMAEGNPADALKVLQTQKGSGAVLRNLNYLLSRAKTEEEIDSILSKIETDNIPVLIQMIVSYDVPSDRLRNFIFERHQMLFRHSETVEEAERRKSALPQNVRIHVRETLLSKLRALLKNKLGKVYIAPEMYRIALPLQEGTSKGGYGTLPKGSRFSIPADKKIRAFTYWEGVNDIDLSALGISRLWQTSEEFSWRTMSDRQSKGICFSGDQTSGMRGGSEFYDLTPSAFKREYPHVQYLLFFDNVYSQVPFSDCTCTAGFMLRDRKDSGEIFEPKTVKTSFRIDCNSTHACLFGLDLSTDEFVWLNLSLAGQQYIAGGTDYSFLEKYLHLTETLNVGTLAEMLATEVVSDPSRADVVVANEAENVRPDAEVVHSWDFEKVLAWMNGNFR